MKAPISAAIAIAFGFIVLLGYFISFPLLMTLRDILLQWAVILAAVALILGVVNLFNVHWGKISKEQSGSGYSIIVILSLVITLLVGGYFGPTGTWTLWIFNYIQLPIESSLMALLAVVLVLASARLLRKRMGVFPVVFFVTVVVMLLGAVPWFGLEVPGIHGPDGIRSLIAQIPAVAGVRGILLGVALGTIATGLRVLVGADRPFGG